MHACMRMISARWLRTYQATLKPAWQLWLLEQLPWRYQRCAVHATRQATTWHAIRDGATELGSQDSQRWGTGPGSHCTPGAAAPAAEGSGWARRRRRRMPPAPARRLCPTRRSGCALADQPPVDHVLALFNATLHAVPLHLGNAPCMRALGHQCALVQHLRRAFVVWNGRGLGLRVSHPVLQGRQAGRLRHLQLRSRSRGML